MVRSLAFTYVQDQYKDNHTPKTFQHIPARCNGTYMYVYHAYIFYMVFYINV